MKFPLLCVFLILCISIKSQDTAGTAQGSLKQEPAPVAQDTAKPVRRNIIRPNPDSLRKIDSLNAIADSILHSRVEKKKVDLEKAFLIEKYPSVYGSWAGGFLKNDKRFNVTAPVPRVPVLVRTPPRFEWIFYLFCGILLMLSFLRVAFYKFFNDLFKVFFNTSIRQKQIKEQLSQSPLPSLLLNIFFFITGGIFIYFLINYYGFDTDLPVALTVLVCMGALALLYLGKSLFLSLAGWMFDRSRVAENYMFTVFMVNKMAGLFLLPVDILLAYSNAATRQVIITISIIGLIILALIRLFRGFQAISNILKINPLQFIIYVAAFEVIPVMLIYKVLLVVIG